MSNLPGADKASALVFSRPFKSHRHVRAEVAKGTRNSRRDRDKNSKLVGVSSGRTTRLKNVVHHCRGSRHDSAGADADGAAVAVWRQGIRVAHTGDGVLRSRAGHPDRVGVVGWI